jgi:uncharacterized repeat protein (TIGR03803 family)
MSPRFSAALLGLMLTAVPAVGSEAAVQFSPIQTVFSFAGGKGGANPAGGLVPLDGKLYGATVAGGGFGKAGTTFEFDPATHGFSILHAFADGNDGEQPYAGPAAFDGKLYGTTFQGGKVGFGTLYQLDPVTRHLGTLHSFTSLGDGGHPESRPVVLDGMLYGTTFDGGNAPISCINTNPGLYWGCGVLYRYDPLKNRTTVAHAFDETDGLTVPAPLTAAHGVLYGVTQRGGHYGAGTVFRFDPAGALTTLHSFNYGPQEGAWPLSAVVVAGKMLYGIAIYGGSTKACIDGPETCGTIYQIDLATNAFTTLYRFSGGRDGFAPMGLIYANGLLYGATNAGGKYGRGTVFKLDPATQAFASVYSFTGGADGANPVGALTELGGELYGVTNAGGSANQGTIFAYTP